MDRDTIVGIDRRKLAEFAVVLAGQIGFGDDGEHVLATDIDVEHHGRFTASAIGMNQEFGLAGGLILLAGKHFNR